MVDNDSPLGDEPLEQLFRRLAEVEAEIEGRRVPKCVMMTDLAGYTSFTDRHGDVAGRKLVKQTAQIVIPLAERHGGRVLKGLGDGWLILFADPNEGTQAAVEIQRTIQSTQNAESRSIQLKIALDYGKLIDEKDDIYGNVVNVCSRMVGLCQGGQILVSNTVFEALDPFYRWRSQAMPAVRIRGKTDTAFTYLVHWQEGEIPSSVKVHKGCFALEVRWNGTESQMSWGRVSEGTTTLTSYKTHSLRLDRIEEAADNMNQIIRSANLGGALEQGLEDIQKIGTELFDLLFPEEIRNQIRQTDADSIILKLDDACVHVPWELVHDANDFLCCRFSVGRLARTSQVFNGVHRSYPTESFSMLILSNPNEDLPAATDEGRNLFDQGHADSRVKPEWINGAGIQETVLEQLGGYDIVHYCGHADHCSENPDKSGWVLSQGRVTAENLKSHFRESEPAPLLVFNNACHSGTTKSWKTASVGWSHGLANAFLLGGCGHYIGVLSELLDLSSKEFAKNFYRHVIAGYPIGQALRHARLENRSDKQERNLTWAQYVLYGNPDMGIFGPERMEPTLANGQVEAASLPEVPETVEQIPPPGEVSEAPPPRETVSPAPQQVRREENKSDREKTRLPTKTCARKSTLTVFASVIAILAILSTLFLVFQPKPGPDPEVVERAYRLVRDGEFSEAKPLLEQILQESEHAEMPGILALLAFSEGQTTDAKTLIEQSPDRSDQSPLATLVLASLEWSQGNNEQAMDLTQAVLENPKATAWEKSDAWRIRGRIAFAKDDLDQAFMCYEQAVSSASDDILLWADRGLICEASGNLEAARAAYVAALQINPDDSYLLELKESCDARIETKRDEYIWSEVRGSLERLEESYRMRGKIQVDPWTSRPLTITFHDFEIEGQPLRSLHEKDRLIRDLRRVLWKTGRLKVVPNYSEIEKQLRELEIGVSELADTEASSQLKKYLGARLSIEGYVTKTADNTTVELEVFDNETRVYKVPAIAETTAEIKQILPDLANQVFKTLDSEYPLQARVESVSETIHLNIGALHGVQVDTSFDIFPKEEDPRAVDFISGSPVAAVSVSSVNEYSCDCELVDGAIADITPRMRARVCNVD